MENIQKFINAVSASDFDYSQYLSSHREEFISKKSPSEPSYKVETTSKAARIATEIILGILSVVFLPYGLYRLMHLIAGKIIVPAQWRGDHHELRKAFVDRLANDKSANSLVAKRISVMVNGNKIDAWILGRKDTLNNKRWTLISDGNNATVEGRLSNLNDINKKIDELGTNILLYNYQGVGASEGWATREGIVDAHKAMVSFLEDEGAKEIIQWGVSIGGGVLGHAMKNHKMKEGVKYVFVKEQTFSKISKVPGPFLGGLIRFFGWELSSVSSSKKLENEKKPEIILQTANTMDCLTPENVKHDGVIPKEGAHAFNILNSSQKWSHKKIIGLRAGHCFGLGYAEISCVMNTIKYALQKEYTGFHRAMN